MPDHILIVDDEATTIDLLRLMLKMLNVPAEGATTGKEALALAMGNPPLMILLDLMLPDISGFEVCRMLKSSPVTAHVPIVMITAHPGHDAHDKAIALGVTRILTKPITRAQLRECVEMIARTG